MKTTNFIPEISGCLVILLAANAMLRTKPFLPHALCPFVMKNFKLLCNVSFPEQFCTIPALSFTVMNHMVTWVFKFMVFGSCGINAKEPM